MKTTAYQKRNLERLEKAMASIKVYPELMFATVASTTEEGKSYIVDFDKTLHAYHCTCKGNDEFHEDCLHQLALDRHFDAERPNPFKNMRSRFDVRAARRAAFVAAFDPDLVA